MKLFKSYRLRLPAILAVASLTLALTVSDASAAEDLTPCQIQVQSTANHMRIGWPKDPDVMPSIGNVKILVLAIDFSDAPMSGDPTGEYKNLMQLEKISAFYKSVSNGFFKPTFEIYPKYVRMKENSEHYGKILERDELVDGEWESHHITHDAMREVDGIVDLSQYKAALVIVSGGKSLSGRVALATSQDVNSDPHKTGEIHNTILAGIRSFAESGVVPWRILVHEINHLMGLADLYLYSQDGWWQGKSPGAFGQQGFLRGSSQSDSLAWNRWLQGWVPNTRVQCNAAAATVSDIPMSQPGTIDNRHEIVITRINEHIVLVVEALKTKGFEAQASKNSMLVYLVDSWVKPGLGPVKIIPKKSAMTYAPLTPEIPDWIRYKDAPIAPGQSITWENFVIRNNKLSGGKMTLTITVKTGPVKTES